MGKLVLGGCAAIVAVGAIAAAFAIHALRGL